MGDSLPLRDTPNTPNDRHPPSQVHSQNSPVSANARLNGAGPALAHRVNADRTVHPGTGPCISISRIRGCDGDSLRSDRAKYCSEGASMLNGLRVGVSEKDQGSLGKYIDSGDEMCIHCGGTPCLWMEIGEEILAKVKEGLEYDECGDENNHLRRKSAYKLYTYERYGFLGSGTRKKIPHCAMAGIRAVWPDSRGSYMGYKSE